MRRRLHAGVDHPDLAGSLNNVGASLEAMGDRAAGVALKREALEMRRRLHAGVDHPDLAASLRNVAISCLSCRDSSGAQSLLRDEVLLRMRLSVYRDDPDLAVALYLFSRSIPGGCRPMEQVATEMAFRIVLCAV